MEIKKQMQLQEYGVIMEDKKSKNNGVKSNAGVKFNSKVEGVDRSSYYSPRNKYKPEQ